MKKLFITFGIIFMVVLVCCAIAFGLMAATTTKAKAQSYSFTPTAIPTTDKVLIADETWKKENAKSISIITTNEQIAHIIQTKYYTYSSMSLTKKHDRKGDYWQYTFRYKREDYKAPKL